MEALGALSDVRGVVRREANALDALTQRLAAAAATLDILPGGEGTASGGEAASLLTCLAHRLFDEPDLATAWLTLTSFAAACPDQAELESLWRRIELARDPGEVLDALLRSSTDVCARAGKPLARVDIVQGTVLLDVELSGSTRADPETRLLSSALRPALGDDCLDVSWNARGSGLEWKLRDIDPSNETSPQPTLVVPWRCVIAVVGTPPPSSCAPLAALAAQSGNAVVLVAPDLAAVANADLIPRDDVGRGVEYVSVVKYAQTVVAPSFAAAEQLRGLQQMLASQGLPGPTVVTAPLPGFDPSAPIADCGRPSPGGSRVMVLGHPGAGGGVDIALAAARRLWDSGSSFALHVPARDWQPRQREQVAADVRIYSKRVTIDHHLGPDDVTRVRAPARCCLCIPLSDSSLAAVSDVLQAGIPLLTSTVGSLSQTTAGALHVDPHNVDLVAAALQTLLDNRSSAVRPVRTWGHWAAEVADIVASAGARA